MKPVQNFFGQKEYIDTNICLKDVQLKLNIPVDYPALFSSFLVKLLERRHGSLRCVLKWQQNILWRTSYDIHHFCDYAIFKSNCSRHKNDGSHRLSIHERGACLRCEKEDYSSLQTVGNDTSWSTFQHAVIVNSITK